MSTVTWTLELEGSHAASISPSKIEQILFDGLGSDVDRVEIG